MQKHDAKQKTPIKATQLMHTTSGMGCTVERSDRVAKHFDEYSLQLRHSVAVLGQEFTGNDFSLVIGQVWPVQRIENAITSEDVVEHQRVVNQRFSNVIDLLAPIVYFGVGYEGGVPHFYRFGRDVYDPIIRRLPSHMKFGVNQNASPLPNSPAVNSMTAIADHLLFNDFDTFTKWFIDEGYAGNTDGRAIGDGSAKGLHMGLV